MKIKGLSIKSALNKLRNENKIHNMSFDKELNYIKFTNSTGQWHIKKITKTETCKSCLNDFEEYIIFFEDEKQCVRCERCLLYSLENYEYCGWTDKY